MKTLSEKYFREVLGFDTASAVGKGIGSQFSNAGKKLRDQVKANRLKNPGQSFGQSVNAFKNNPLAKQAGQSTAAAIGGTAGKAALGGLYVGAAYLAYKGLMKLKDKLANSKNPQEKQNLQKQVAQGQAKLQRAKELNKVKQKQESEKRQRDSQR